MIKRKIALILALLTISAPIAQVSAKNNQKIVPAVTKKVVEKKDSQNKIKNMSGIKGNITSITKEKNKVTALIKGKSLTENGFNEVRLVINNGTKVSDQKNNKLSLNDLKEGMIIEAYFTPKATKSNPPMVIAKEIKVISEDEYAQLPIAEGNIVNISKNKNGIMALVQQKETENPMEGQINLLIGEKTEIVNEADGKKLTIDDIKDGMKIRAYYGPATTMSIPPQSNARKIIVLKTEDAYAELSVTEGNIVDIYESKNGIRAVVQEKQTQNPMEGQIELLISEKTEIIDEATGKNLAVEDIKDGMKIKGFYGPAMTMSIPPQSNAKKVIVLKDQKKNLYEVECNVIDTFEYENGIMAYVKSKNERFFTFITDYSQIINENGDKELDINDIKKDTKIKLYFSQRNSLLRLRSYLPNICLAEKVVIMEDLQEELLATEGTVKEIINSKDDVMALIDGKKINDKGYNEIKLLINMETEIIQEDGSKASFEDIIEGTKVKAFYGPKVTRSLPPIGIAEKIIIEN